MRILDRYVTSEFIRLFLLFSLAAPALFILGDWTDNLDTFTSRQIPPLRVALSYIYQFPLFVLWSFPIAALIATVFTVSNMTRHAEMTAAKAGGISFWRAAAMLPVLGALLTVVGLGLSELVPVSLEKRAEVLGEKRRAPGIRSNFVYRTESGEVFSVRQLDAEMGRMLNLIMEREGDGASVPGLHVSAQEAVYDTTRGTWSLSNGHFRMFPPGQAERMFAFQQLFVPHLREAPEQLLAEPKEPDEMRYGELSRFIQILERSGGKPLELRVELAQKIAIPAATFIIVLFGAPLANTQARGGPAYGIGISLGITILYLMLFRISGAFGATGLMPPVVAAWIPNGLFLLAAIGLTAKVRT